MKQYKTFSYPLYKPNTSYANPVKLAVGDTATLILRDRSLTTVVVTDILDGPSGSAQRIGWAITNGQPRSQDVIGAGGIHQFVCPFSDYDYDTYDTPPDEPDFTGPHTDYDPFPYQPLPPGEGASPNI